MQHTIDTILGTINVLFCVGYVYVMLSSRFDDFTGLTKGMLQISLFRRILDISFVVGMVFNWVLFHWVWDMPYTFWTNLIGSILVFGLLVHLHIKGARANPEIRSYPCE